MPVRGDETGSPWTLYGGFEDATWETEPITVNGTYDPIVGDFDGNGCTDILWYGPGSAPDSIWYREADGTFTVQPITINGTYAPVTGDFGGEDATDIFWYSTTGGTESFWLGTSDRTFVTESAPQVSYSGYRLTSRGSGIFFHRPGPGTDYAWESVTAGDPAPAQNIPLQIDGDYLPYAMSAGILLYAPGPATDRLIWWDGDALEVVNGTYRLGRVPGDLPVSFILFHGPGAAPDSLWVSGVDPEDDQYEGEIGAAALFG